LQDAFSRHLEETRRQIERLEELSAKLSIKLGREKCGAMEGLIKEAMKLLRAETEPEVLDAGLIAAVQRIEHYEIAGYGVARAFAHALGYNDAAVLLRQTLDEEASADQSLTAIAEDGLNADAAYLTKKPQYEDEQDDEESDFVQRLEERKYGRNHRSF
jgi:ferritin-like metal-binding protein YciE